MITRYIHENISYITRRYYTCEGCYYTGARYVPRTVVPGKKIEPVFSMLRSYKRILHLGENVPRNAPRARNEDDRRETDVIKDDARGVGRKIGRCGFPAAEEAAAPRYAPSRYRPSRVMRCDCTAYDCLPNGASSRSPLCPYLQFHDFNLP